MIEFVTFPVFERKLVLGAGHQVKAQQSELKQRESMQLSRQLVYPYIPLAGGNLARVA